MRFAHRPIPFFFACLVLLSGFPLHAAEPKWQLISSDHFQVVTDAGQKKGHEVIARFEQMRSVFSELLGRRKVRMSQPIVILALANPGTYAQLAPQGTSLPAFFLRGEERVFIVINTSVEDSWRAVEHPLAHYLLDYNYPPTAAWFDEGFAEYFASLYFTNKNTQLGSDPELAWPGQPAYSEQAPGLKSFTELLSNPVWLNLADLMQMRNRVVNGREGTHHTLFYAQSWVLMHYLLNQNKLTQAGTYFDLVENQRTPFAESVQQAFGVTPAQLDQQVKDYFHSLKPLQTSLAEAQAPTPPATPEPVQVSPLPFPADEVAASSRDLPAREADALLAEMELRMPEHREEAIQQLTKGIELAPKNADGHNIYGVILARQGKLNQAIAELQQAVDLAPRSAECRYNLGRAFAANGRFGEALPQFEAAASLSGGKEPAILQMLAAMYSEIGKYTQAITTAQQALELAEKQQNQELAAALRGNIALYEHQAQTGPSQTP